MSDSLTVADVTVGAMLPEVELLTTRSFVVTSAIATRDFEPVHHDPEVARASGLPDVFLNILTTNGLCVKYVADWAGPQAIVKGTSIRLGVPHVAGATLRLSGEVTAIDGAVVTVAVAGRNATGNHVTGTVQVDLPEAALPPIDSSTEAPA
jgi:acyl dehydratase